MHEQWEIYNRWACACGRFGKSNRKNETKRKMYCAIIPKISVTPGTLRIDMDKRGIFLKVFQKELIYFMM